MPISFKDFVEVRRRLPKNASPEEIDKAVAESQKPGLVERGWAAANRPLAGAKDALIPQLKHEHKPEEGGIRRTAEDFAAGLTSPVNLALTGLGVGAAKAGAKGALGISRAARFGEAALQAPMAAEGLKNITEGETPGQKLAGVAQAGLAGAGIRSAMSHPLEPVFQEFLTKHGLEHGQIQAAMSPAVERGAAQSVASSAPGAIEHSAPTLAVESQSPSPSLKVSPEVLTAVQKHHLVNGGSTTDLRAGRMLTPQDARYMLSPYEEHQQVLDHAPTTEELSKYAQEKAGLLSQPGHNLGTWDNSKGDGKHYLDVSIGENDLQKALALGAQHKQKAIYDMVAGEDVKVPSEGAASAVHPASALSVAAPAISSQIDDSNPDDPHQQLKHYAKLGLDIATLAGAAAFAVPFIRKSPLTLDKDAAARGAALMMLGKDPEHIAGAFRSMGLPEHSLDKAFKASQKILETQALKSETGLTGVEKLTEFLHSGKGEANWYNTKDELIKQFGKDAPIVARLIAATSNNSTVKSNMTLALKAYAQHKAHPEIPIAGIMKTLLPSIDLARQGHDLIGRKVENFARALMGDENAVVVDRWMMRAWGFKGIVPNLTQYDTIEHGVKQLAKDHGMSPREVQAAIWFGAKKEMEAGMSRPESPPYDQLLQQVFPKGVHPPQALQMALDSWKAKPKAGFGNTLKKASTTLQQAILPAKPTAPGVLTGRAPKRSKVAAA